MRWLLVAILTVHGLIHLMGPYVNPEGQKIEMASVGADGQLFVLTGPLGGETRQTSFTGPDGRRILLRFTRSHVSADRFESRMERSTDNGATWQPGNHQVFTRARRP